MCGIYGVFPKNPSGINYADLEVFQLMGNVTHPRGRDSTGWFFPVKDTKLTPRHIKMVGNAFNIIDSEAGQKFLGIAFKQGAAIVGHGRKATVGKITAKNAHPFKEGDWTLVHNGTITGGVDSTEAEVDSHGLVLKIAEVGVEQALKGIHGAYAIILYNHAQERFYFGRNHQRPLHYFKNYVNMYVMSDRLDLEYCLSKSNIHYTQNDIKLFPAEKLFHMDLFGDLVEGESVARPPAYERISYFPRHHSQGYYEQSERREPVIPAKEKEVVSFLVESIGKYGKKRFKYFCTDEQNRRVVFYMKTENPSLLTACGMGEIMHQQQVREYDKATNSTVQINEWIMNASTIEWDTPEESAAIVENLEDAPKSEDANVKTYGGRVIPLDRFRELCKNKSCYNCRGAIDPADASLTIVAERGGDEKLVCKSCIRDHNDLYGPIQSHAHDIIRTLQ